MKWKHKRKRWTGEELMAFETKVKELFEAGEINAPIHLSGGNESHLMSIFDLINNEDYIISTHRNHYHYLLKGGSPAKLLDEILGKKSGICKGNGRSMHVYDTKLNFYTSAIVGGGCAIAVGLGLAIKKKVKGKKKMPHIWCFLGDGAEDGGHFIEAARFALGRGLPITFVVEDNDRAVESTKQERWHLHPAFTAPNVLRYNYVLSYPHVGVGQHISM